LTLPARVLAGVNIITGASLARLRTSLSLPPWTTVCAITARATLESAS